MSVESKFITLCFSVFLAFLCIGIPLAILPEFVHHKLGFSMLISGVAIGLQSLVTVMSRQYAGKCADLTGAKPTTQKGFLACIIAALFYILAAYFTYLPSFSITSLLLGRAILGFGESLILTGVLTWGIELLGRPSSGKVMSWNGIAMYGAIAIGSPIGLALYGGYSFMGIALAFLLLSTLGYVIASVFSYQKSSTTLQKISFVSVVKTIWLYGLGYALGGVGFGALSAFISVLFKTKGWPDVEWALIGFGSCYILVRLFFGNLPDKTGGGPVAIVSSILEALGLSVLWLADTPMYAVIGACVAGIGFSLLFPAFGVQALKRVSPESKGTALGAFSSFFDVTLGVTGPICGLIISYHSVESIYLFGSLCCFLTLLIALRLQTNAFQKS